MNEPSDRRTEAIIRLSEVLASERLDAWDRRLKDIDRILRGTGEGGGLVATVQRLAAMSAKHERILVGEAGDGLAARVRTNSEAVALGRRLVTWVVSLLVVQLIATLGFLFQFLWEQVTGG